MKTHLITGRNIFLPRVLSIQDGNGRTKFGDNSWLETDHSEGTQPRAEARVRGWQVDYLIPDWGRCLKFHPFEMPAF